MATEGPDRVTGCTFCRIARGEGPAAIVERTESTVSFLDLRQPNWPGGIHALAIPTEHVEQIDGLPADLAGHLMTAVVRLSRAVRRLCEPDGLSVWSSNGPAAFQEVPHVHLHVLARRPDDGLLRVYAERPDHPDPADLERTAQRLSTEFDR